MNGILKELIYGLVATLGVGYSIYAMYRRLLKLESRKYSKAQDIEG